MVIKSLGYKVQRYSCMIFGSHFSICEVDAKYKLIFQHTNLFKVEKVVKKLRCTFGGDDEDTDNGRRSSNMHPQKKRKLQQGL